MKIKTQKVTIEELEKIKPYARFKPARRSLILKGLIRLLSIPTLKKLKFKYNTYNMEHVNPKEPHLIVMNHTNFADMKIAFKMLKKFKINIVCTDDGFIGKKLLMKYIGCMPTRKYSADLHLVKDMIYTVKTLKSSILIYPEACYSFDGTSTVIPESFGKCIKLLNIPVITIITHGTFFFDPLYNNLQYRKTHGYADMKYVLSKEDIKNKSIEEINEIINNEFKFDQFKYQQENNIIINEPFRADYLHKILYKCPHCLVENKTVGKGITLTCTECGNTYELTENGYLKNISGNETIFNHIPTWNAWQRECVKEEIKNDTYLLDEDIDLYAIKNFKTVYEIGKAHLKHTKDELVLTDESGKHLFTQSTKSLYTLNTDFHWYQIADTICIGDEKVRYYCAFKNHQNYVSKARMATEENYKLNKTKESN